MLLDEIKNIKSAKKDLRDFGLVVGGALLLLSGLLFWRHKESYAYFLIPGAALVSLALLAPSVLKPLQRAWMALAVLLGWFTTRVILVILFYLALTPVAVVLRLSGKRFLELERTEGGSYWKRREIKEGDGVDYERQF